MANSRVAIAADTSGLFDTSPVDFEAFDIHHGGSNVGNHGRSEADRAGVLRRHLEVGNGSNESIVCRVVGMLVSGVRK